MAGSLSPFRSRAQLRGLWCCRRGVPPSQTPVPGQQPLHSLKTVSLFSVPPFVVGPPPPLWVAAILRRLDPSTDQGSWVRLPPSGLPGETGHCAQLGSPPALLWTLPTLRSLLPLTLIQEEIRQLAAPHLLATSRLQTIKRGFLFSIFSLLVSSSCPSWPVSDSSIRPLSSDFTFSHFPQSPHCALLC